ncbi:prenylcysteine oxidase 1-like [Scleropages formosus]|uniref:Prenylcysteine oxidase 1 n=1 Tax=Scleropages formosus TaxID=113540 RepID=A0A0P7WTQ5_SCLFO|nr:prenylcysteine oxidase 1 [Scleropages formosus]KPP65183.1 prenylcysteine oxidase 1-like [Scleropages formosus]
MSFRILPVKTLLFLALCLSGRRGLASAPELKEQPKKIAVIGAGIGGTATAYYLRQEFGPEVKIDVFEAGTVGGRLATEKIGSDEYEMGGSIIHPLNLHMKHFVDLLGLSACKDVPGKMAVFDSEELIFEESDWFIVNFLRMLWRYGFNFLRMHMWVESLLDKFMRIYQYQQYGYSFSSVERLFHAMGGDDFVVLANKTLGEAMLEAGFSQNFLNDIVIPVTRFNYGQSVRINGFVGVISLSAMDSGLWAVNNGNKRVCSGLLYHSRAELIPAQVTSITFKLRPIKSGETVSLYEVSYTGESGSAHSMYDIVIVATPLHQELSKIAFSGFSPPIVSHFPGHYKQIVTTLVHGVLNTSFLGVTNDPSGFWVSNIFTKENKDISFYSLSSVDPVHIPDNYVRPPASAKKVWKLFSSQQLSEAQLGQIFLSWDAVRERKWLAYPIYMPPHQRPPFLLHDRLYYLNPIEWAASSMEMSALSARNVVLLAHHRWHGQESKIDQEDLHTRLRSEL